MKVAKDRDLVQFFPFFALSLCFLHLKGLDDRIPAGSDSAPHACNGGIYMHAAEYKSKEIVMYSKISLGMILLNKMSPKEI